MNKEDILKSYVPEFIRQNILFQFIYKIQGNELTKVDTAIEDLLNQCFIESATWGLDFWESFIGIPTDKSKPDLYRKTVIKSKLRGAGTITVNLIQNVAQSFDNGEVDIIEHPEAYSFEVKFIGTKGIPPNLNDLKAAMEEIKPAHLSVTYNFTYTTWGEVKETTWNSVKGGTWGALKTREVI